MRSIVEWILGIGTLLALMAGIGLIVGVFVGSMAGAAMFIFEALR
jgi:hypothetical protein